MPMKVLVIGANGNTGFRVVRHLARSPHAPLAMIRAVQQREGFFEAEKHPRPQPGGGEDRHPA